MKIHSFFSFLQSIPNKDNILITFFSIKGSSSIRINDYSFNSLANLYNFLNPVLKYDGFIFIEEKTGNMISSFDEVFEEANLYGFFTKDKEISKLSVDDLKTLYSVNSFGLKDPYSSGFFHYC